MKLKTYLNENKTEIVSIGTRNGSEYVYIGEAGNVDQIVQEFERKHNNVIANLKALERELAELVREKPDTDINGALEYANRISNVYRNIKKHRTYLEDYVEVLKRDVCEVEPRAGDEGVRVIITGSERGSYWFKSEYDAGH
jgi:hypothetical protein